MEPISPSNIRARSHPVEVPATKDPSPRWDEQRERRNLKMFSRAIGRETSPTPSVSSRYARKIGVHPPSRLRTVARISEEPDESTTINASSNAPDTGHSNVSHMPNEEDADISSAAMLLNKHEANHPYCKTAIGQLVELMFSDDKFDAGISKRTATLAEKLLSHGLDNSKLDVVAADLMENARHSKATRLGRTLTDETALHVFLDDLKAGIPDRNINDLVRKWQRDLEARKSGVDRGVDAGTATPPQLATPTSQHSTGPMDFRVSHVHGEQVMDRALDGEPDDVDAGGVDINVTGEEQFYVSGGLAEDDFVRDDLTHDSHFDATDDFVYDSYQRDVRGADPNQHAYDDRSESDLYGCSVSPRPRRHGPEPTTRHGTEVEEVMEDSDKENIDTDMIESRAEEGPPLDTNMNGSLPDKTCPDADLNPPPESNLGVDANMEESESEERLFDTAMAEPMSHHPRRIADFTKRFPDALSVFIFHAHLVLGRKCTPSSPGNPKVTQRAESIWSTLTALERAAWDPLCLRLQTGDGGPLDPLVGFDLFRRQGLLERLQAPPEEILSFIPTEHVLPVRPKPSRLVEEQSDKRSSTRSSRSSFSRGPGRRPSHHHHHVARNTRTSSRGPSRYRGKSRRPSHSQAPYQPEVPQPNITLISDSTRVPHSRPVVVTYDDDSANNRRIAFVIGTPDSQINHLDTVDFQYACRTSFGDRAELEHCGMLHERLWVAQLEDANAVERAVHDGASMQYGNVRLYGEAFPRPTKLLECDLALTDVTPQELIDAVADTLRRSHCKLFKSPTAGRYMLVVPIPSRFILRLYLPVSRRGVVATHVCFRPMNPETPCSACGVVHIDVCPQANRVPLKPRKHGQQ